MPCSARFPASSITIGLIVGALTSDWLAQRDKRWSAWIAIVGLFFAPIIYYFAFRMESLAAATIALTAAAAVLLLFYGPTLGMIQNLLDAQDACDRHGAVERVLYARRLSVGPPIVGFLSDRFAQRAFGTQSFVATCPGGVAPKGAAQTLVDACASASAVGIQQAMSIIVCSAFIACLCYFMASRTLKEDLYVGAAARAPRNRFMRRHEKFLCLKIIHLVNDVRRGDASSSVGDVRR